MGTASLILGIVSLVIGFIPLLGVIAIFPAIAGLIVGIIDTTKKNKTNEKKGQSIAGIVTSAIAIALIVFWIFIVAGTDTKETNQSHVDKETKIEEQIIKQEEKKKIVVADLSSMTKNEIQEWANNNNIKIKFTEEYSDSVEKGNYISQSISADQVIHEGDTITIRYSLGKKPTTEDKNALKKAESYSNIMHMSKQGIYRQLISSFEGFSQESAQYAIDNIKVDWNKNALEKAKSYRNTMNMSKNAVYNQLISSAEGFTREEAQYAIDHLDD